MYTTAFRLSSVISGAYSRVWELCWKGPVTVPVQNWDVVGKRVIHGPAVRGLFLPRILMSGSLLLPLSLSPSTLPAQWSPLCMLWLKSHIFILVFRCVCVCVGGGLSYITSCGHESGFVHICVGSVFSDKIIKTLPKCLIKFILYPVGPPGEECWLQSLLEAVYRSVLLTIADRPKNHPYNGSVSTVSMPTPWAQAISL